VALPDPHPDQLRELDTKGNGLLPPRHLARARCVKRRAHPFLPPESPVGYPHRVKTHEWAISQARRLQLWAVGLLEAPSPAGAESLRDVFRRLGGLQLDPLPILGRNHDLVVQSRLNGSHPGDVLSAIHANRWGFEYWDKALCVLPIEQYPMFHALMMAGGESWIRGRQKRLEREHPGALDDVLAAVADHGPVSSRELKELDVAQGDHRGWKLTKAANTALEILWNDGRLAVSHRDRFRRYFDLTERVIPSEHLRNPLSIDAFARWLLKKRVQAVGLLPASGDAEAWAFLRRARSGGLAQELVEREELSLIRVEGLAKPFYAPAGAAETIERLPAPDDRVARFIAPLDPLVWARTGLERLWNFHYVWEVYKPPAKRTYGYYVLPVLVGDRFVGRFDGRYDRTTRTLSVLSYREEPSGLPLNHPAIHRGFQRFLGYLDGERIHVPNGKVWPREA